MPTITINKRAKFDYEILKKYEAGLVLTGQEVKSIKTGHISLKGSYVTIRDGEAYLINAHIPPYKMSGQIKDYESTRPRKLLLHKKELKSLIGRVKEKGLTLMPLRVYTKRKRLKLEFGVGRGLRKIDKRELIKKREVERKIRQARGVKELRI